MVHLIRLLAVAALVSFLALPFPALAQEEVPTEQEIRQTEGEPPVVPHRMKDADTAKDCLKCHLKGKKGAPVTPHPERKACTQCHVQGEIKAVNPAGKNK